MRSFKNVFAATVVVAGTALLAVLSQWPYAPAGETDAVVRLAWRTRSVRRDKCRTLSAEELAKVPAHMQRSEVCESTVVPYRLQVIIDGREVLDEIVRSAGVRKDRPLFVYHELPVTPEAHDLVVRFTRQTAVDAAGAGSDEATPARLELERRINLSPLQVALVTYDVEQRRLILKMNIKEDSSH